MLCWYCIKGAAMQQQSRLPRDASAREREKDIGRLKENKTIKENEGEGSREPMPLQQTKYLKVSRRTDET